MPKLTKCVGSYLTTKRVEFSSNGSALTTRTRWIGNEPLCELSWTAELRGNHQETSTANDWSTTRGFTPHHLWTRI